MTQEPSVTQQFIDNADEYIRRLLYREGISNKDETIQHIRKKYFREPMTVKTVQEDIVNFFTDSYFIYPMEEALARHKGPVYQYLYNYRAASSLSDIYNADLNLGTNHADEIFLLFNLTEHCSKTDPKDIELSKNLVKMWVNFAKNSNPSTETISWPELRSSRGEYLNFNSQISIGRHLKQEISSWWANLPLYRVATFNVKSEL